MKKNFESQEIRLEGNVVHFDGRYDEVSETLHIFKMYGDVTLFGDAIQDFCLENKIKKAIVSLTFYTQTK